MTVDSWTVQTWPVAQALRFNLIFNERVILCGVDAEEQIKIVTNSQPNFDVVDSSYKNQLQLCCAQVMLNFQHLSNIGHQLMTN